MADMDSTFVVCDCCSNRHEKHHKKYTCGGCGFHYCKECFQFDIYKCPICKKEVCEHCLSYQIDQPGEIFNDFLEDQNISIDFICTECMKKIIEKENEMIKEREDFFKELKKKKGKKHATK